MPIYTQEVEDNIINVVTLLNWKLLPLHAEQNEQIKSTTSAKGLLHSRCISYV